MTTGSTTPIRVLLYTEAPAEGGVTTVMASLAGGLAGRVTFYAVTPPGLTGGRRWKQVSGLMQEISAAAIRGSSLLRWLDVPGWIRLSRLLKRVNPDICHFHLHTPFSCQQTILLAHLLTRSKIVVTEHYLSRLLFLRRRHRGPLLRFLREVIISANLVIKKLMLRFVDCTIVLSEGDKDLHAARFGENRKTVLVFNGIDVNRFHSGKPGVLGPRKGMSKILVIADLNNQKGHRYLLEALPSILRQVPGARLFLAGDGHLRQELESLVRASAIQRAVTFLGRRDDIPDLLASADLVVLPSLFEGLPLTLLEGMAAAKAIVATDIPGNKDVVRNGETGYLVPSANPGALAEKITALLTNNRLRAAMGRRGVTRVRRLFTAGAMCRNTYHLYQELLQSDLQA